VTHAVAVAADGPIDLPMASQLSRFIRDNAEPILAEWETFARSLHRAQDEKARGARDGGGTRDVTAAQG